MAQPDRPLRADAARNRARVLEVAWETFASEGLSVPIDEIARRAGVGMGTVYRHFPSKDDLVRAIVTDRMRQVIEEADTLLQTGDPAAALFTFLRSVVFEWGATDVALKNALANSEIKIGARGVREPFLAVIDKLLKAAQKAGSVRTDTDAAVVKALVVGCQAMQSYNDKLTEKAIAIVFDGLRAPSA